MKKYRRLTWIDRLRIDALYNTGHSYRFIASHLGFSVSSIHNEVQHGLYPHMGAECSIRPVRYSAQIAQDYADRQATAKGVEIKLGHNYAYAQFVAQQVKRGCSLDTIVGTLKKRGEWTVSTTTLYRYIDRGYIPGVTNKYLPEKSRRKKKKAHIRPAARPPKGQSIERRPHDINRRLSFGHWEMDSVIGKSSGERESLLVLTERKTRYEIILRTKAKTAAATIQAFERALSKYPPSLFRTITVDNGSEFQDCYRLEHDRDGNKRLTVYYCHPFCSSERGSNERANRIVRRFFPKGKSMAKVTQKDCDRAALVMNTMPRKIFDYAAPQDLFMQEVQNLNPAFSKIFEKMFEWA